MLGMNINDHFYNYVLDIIDSKIYKSKEAVPKKTHKYICFVQFESKVLETIRLQKIFNQLDIIKKLPINLQEKENIPTVTNNIGNTIRNKILN